MKYIHFIQDLHLSRLQRVFVGDLDGKKRKIRLPFGRRKAVLTIGDLMDFKQWKGGGK